MGGPMAIYYFPDKFPAVIVLSYAWTIILPMIMNIVHLAINDPHLIFNFARKTAEKINKIIMILICILLAFFNHAFLIFNLEEINETAITTVQKLIDATDSGVLQFLEEHKKLKSDVIQFVKIDLG